MREAALKPGALSSRGALRAVGATILVLVFAGLCGRVLNFPLNRDENLFVTVSAMSTFDNLYTVLGYNHLPYLPWLLGAIYRVTGSVHYLLVGRLLVLAAWLVAILGLRSIARQQAAGPAVFWAATSLLIGNILLLGSPGTMVTNNFLPIPAAIWAFRFLLKGMDEAAPKPVSCAVAGVLVSVAVGLKANYIFLAPLFAAATVLAPLKRPLTQRLLRQCLPLAIGGILGALPILMLVASGPQTFFAHTLRYFTEMQAIYWSVSTEPKVTSLPQKLLLAESVWASGASLLVLAGLFVLPALQLARAERPGGRLVLGWPVWLAAALSLCGIIVAFVPTPSFPQYFVPPIPFLLIGLILLRAPTRQDNPEAADAILIALGLVALLCSATRLAPGLVDFVRPGNWRSITIHDEMRGMSRRAGVREGELGVTLTPVLALEAGLKVPPQFAAGQFVYRVADYLPADDRPYYTTTSPTRLQEFLNASPPATIVISGEEDIEEPFEHYARLHRYVEFTGSRPEGPRLFRRAISTAAVNADPAP
ncbi:hypothetical protein AB3M93_12985 [Novosphingobium panipatense]|uniref:hypothetical protein n=1 Tax=Novosphingobium TaxID=165696 RepID=UPI000CDA716D|nr:hypothetical protein [Novosphingobium sp. HII-3]